MELIIQSPSKALNKAYLKEKVARKDIELFKEQLTLLFTKVQTEYSEDTLKDYITEFLRNTWYNPHHAITINKERKDLTIHTGKTAKDPAAVIAEIKKIDSPEMMSPGKPNVKALHELVLYYMQERVTSSNNEIKFLLATDVNNWILIDANEFDKKIYRNAKIKKLYEVFVNDKKDNPFFYDELKKILADTEEAIYATQFNLNDYRKVITNTDKADDKKLIALYKILSPSHLLKLPFTNDSNSLDKGFYAELLHLIGLEEVKEGSKKLIQRKKESSEASLLENAIIKLKDKDCLRDVPDVTGFGFTNEEQYYNIALELCITWINRILFLKLLEAQLHTYHLGDKQYLFLNDQLIDDYDELNNLFLQVLAEKPATRRERLQTKFSKVPYLNSSLFERTELERKTIDISALDNSLPLPLHYNTVLKDDKGKRRQGQLHTLFYLFTFLDSYDFTSESSADIQEENKTLINASVLGLIFEKINGYKDGSFFTPGFITMYMCRETLRRAVAQKFNEVCGWQCKTFEDLQEKIEFQDKEKRQRANAIINSLTICDPAVGSGHFLVSGLNELIAIKHDLKILQYRHNGQRIKEYSLEIVNDELIIQDIESEELFEYLLNQKGNIKPELQYLQETLFHEKETLIENCLFGVDINANSVKICRLRLWIELLKNSYYKTESLKASPPTGGGGLEGALETLPNIDINIKQGNSLISRFALDADLSATLKKSKWTIDSYKLAVQTYRNAQSKEEKREMEELIDTIKKDFRTDISPNDPINKKLYKLRGEIKTFQQTDLFNADAKKKNKANKELEKLSAAIDKLEKEKEDIQNNAIYKEAFEWRFEFPEVLDSEGKFLGFDVVIGNPPYIALQKMKQEQAAFERMNYETYAKLADIYCLFYEKGVQLLKPKGLLTYITSNSWMRTQYGELLRKYFIKNTNPILLLNIEDTQVFDEATVESNIIILEKDTWGKQLQAASLHEDFNTDVSLEDYFSTNSITVSALPESGWSIGNESEINLKTIVEKGSKLLKDFDIQINYGIKTGFNEVFEIDEHTKNILISEDDNSKEIIKPSLRGRDISKYQFEFKNRWLIFTRRGINIDKYVSVKKYLQQFYDKIRPKNNGEPSGRKPGPYEWYEIQDNVAYFEEFEKEKIVWGELSDEQKFAFDDSGLYANNTIFFITGKNLKYLLSVLNSKLAKWYFNIISTSSGMGTNRWLKYKIEQLPIKDIAVAQQLPFITLTDKILGAKKENPKADTSAWEKEIDQLVYQLYGLSEEEIKMVQST